jgi:CysZ protein
MDFLRGVRHGLAGIALVVTQPRLRPLVALPFVIALALFIGIFAAVIKLIGLAWALAVPVLGLFLFLPVASLVAAPFNEAIAETVEQLRTGREPPPFSAARLLAELGRTIVHEARKIARWLLLSAIVLALSLFVPVVGMVIGLVGGAYVAARFAAYDALDATLSRWGYGYAEKTAFFRKRRALCLGLGAVVAALLLVPVVNAMAMPLGAAGGAVLATTAVPAPPYDARRSRST